MRREFTGRHMAIIMVGFFAVVIGVNVLMAKLAVSTFGGALAENGYVASQDYNKWIAESAAQDKLGWTVDAAVEDRHLIVKTNGAAAPSLDIVAQHPLGRMEDQPVTMVAVGPGTFRSARPLPEGRWQLHIVMSEGRTRAEYLREVRG